MDLLNSNKFGFEPEDLQAVLKSSVTENGPESFISLRHASLYIINHWGTMSFTEIKDMKIGQVLKKGDSFELNISRLYGNQLKRIYIAIVHSRPISYKDNFFPIPILSAYLASRKRLAKALDSDFLFPNLLSCLN